jgi:hypothetical protein
MLGTDGRTVVGVRALLSCAECETPIAGVDAIKKHATAETDVRDCPDYPGASYLLTVEQL